MTAPYLNYFCGNLTDLKQIHPGLGTAISAVIFGPSYPVDESVTYFVWDWFSTATPDDVEYVKPIAEPYEPMENGRWVKVDAAVSPQVNANWTANSGPAAILNKPTLSPVATSGSYADLVGVPTIPAAQVNTDWNASSGKAQLLNKPSLAAVAVSGSYTDLTNKPTIPAAASQSSVTRSLNTAFQISSTRNAFVSYSVQLTVTASISGGQNGDVILEIASDSGFTTNVQTVSIAGLGQTYTLAIALQGVQPQTGVVSGFVPVGYYTRLRTVNNTGTPTYSYRAGQETLV